MPGDCQKNGVSGLAFMSLACGEQAAFEGDREGVECWLPGVHPSPSTTPGRVQAPDDHVEALERGLLVGEVPLRPRGSAHPGVERLDRVGGVDDPADLGVVGQQRGNPELSLPPGPACSYDREQGEGCGDAWQAASWGRGVRWPRA